MLYKVNAFQYINTTAKNVTVMHACTFKECWKGIQPVYSTRQASNTHGCLSNRFIARMCTIYIGSSVNSFRSMVGLHREWTSFHVNVRQ